MTTSSAALAGASLLGSRRRLHAQDDPYGGWPVGVQSYSLRNFNLIEALRHIEGMGVHYVEFYSKHLALDATDAEIQETKDLLARSRIQLNAHGVNNFTRNHAENRQVFEFAKRAGIKNITANPQPDSFESLDRLVAEFKIRICIHNHGPGHMYNKISDVKDAVKDHHPLVGACVDTGHFIRAGEDPVKAVRELNDRVFAVHIKDDTERGRASHNVVIGKANLDVVGLFRALRQVAFPADGALSLEYEANPGNPMDDMKACLAVAREAIAKAAG